ncbi:MAG TPA: hypothetical protein VF576_06150, partial [Rubricoccaceae bacterium]
NPQTGDKSAPAPAVPGIFTTQSVDAPTLPPIEDSYAFGMAAPASPFRIWADFAYGQAEDTWNTDGDRQEISIAGTDGDIVSKRVHVGAEAGLPVGLFGFGLSAGAQLSVAQNTFQRGADSGGFITDNLTSDWGMQAVKFYGLAQAGPIGIHGGYHLDLGSETEFATTGLPTNLSNSDGRDAFFVGADFDYPSPVVRLFGGVDYFKLYGGGTNTPGTPEDESARTGDDLLSAMFGAGFRFSVFELGAALQIQARYSQPVVSNIGTQPGIGGSLATIAPYLRISPPMIPASIFVKGAVQEEYTDFGYGIGGSNTPRPTMGFTAGLTYGFQ